MSKDNRRVTVENAVSGKIEKPWLFLEKCSTYWWEYYSVEFKCNFPSKIFVDNVRRWCYDIVSTEKDIRKRQQNFIRRLFRVCTHETRAFFFPPEKLAPRRFSTSALRSSTNYLKLNSIFPWNSTSKIISNRKEKEKWNKAEQSEVEQKRTHRRVSFDHDDHSLKKRHCERLREHRVPVHPGIGNACFLPYHSRFFGVPGEIAGFTGRSSPTSE